MLFDPFEEQLDLPTQPVELGYRERNALVADQPSASVGRISMATIFKSSLAFLALQALGLLLCILIPGLATWLPRRAFG